MQTATRPLDGYVAAIHDLPAGSRSVAWQGGHHLVAVAPDWMVLVGPDQHGDDLSWVLPHIPDDGTWTVTWVTIGDTLVTHYNAA